jgi:hypothetical protein
MLGTPALNRDAKLNGAALSVAWKPGSVHVDPPSTVIVHAEPEQALPLMSSVITGGVVSRQMRFDGVAPPAPLHG